MPSFSDRYPLSSSPGLVSEQTRQMEEEEEDNQRLPRTGHAAPDPGPATVLRRGRHGEQPLLVPRQRLALGNGDAGGLPASAPAGPGPPAQHGAVAVTVQSGSGPPAELNGSVKRAVLQRFGAAVSPLPVAFPGDVGLSVRSHERIRLPAAV